MTPKSFCLAISTATIACAIPWIAHAEYRCDPPPTQLDRGACKAAAESPAALRQYVQRVQPIRNLRFDDYVNDATVVAWEAAIAREREAERKANESAVAAATKRETR
jgi:hypothetical protein